MKKRTSLHLFISLAFVVLLLLLVSLPGLAGTPSPTLPSASETYTPTSDVNVSQTAGTTSSSPTPTEIVTQTIGITLTQTVGITFTQTTTPTYTSTPTVTPSPTLSPTSAPQLLPTQLQFLPYISKEYSMPTDTPTPPPPPETVLFCDSIGQPLTIPDNNIDGVNNNIPISDGRVLVKTRLYLDITHPFVGDLVVKLTHVDTSQVIRVLNRPLATTGNCGNDNIVSILDDSAAQSVDDQCALYPDAISGIYIPSQPLATFTNMNISGTWRLNVSDRDPLGVGTLNHWCLETSLAEAMPPPTPTPPPVNLPLSAYVSGMTGQDQQLNLDCESRSAVDWAHHFGFNIGEINFLNRLPVSDDPEAGFVGNPDGTWGYVPPDDYGVHAPPVAELLRDYGLTASAYRSLRWDDLRAEIASGNPVIVWIIGDAYRNLVNGIPHYYTAASTGKLTIVAPHEHTVIVTGYSSTDVRVLNGSLSMYVPIDQFLDSWSVLDFMAVLARP